MTLPYPSGWFVLAASSELGRAKVLTRRLAGADVVLFRNERGEAAVVDAYCPHLGAHMGHGGRVREGALECPFHGFRFDRAGACIATGYGTKPPPQARVHSLPVEERAGWLFAWFDPSGAAPTWALPELDPAGWTPLRPHLLRLRTHPQETTENSVDAGHFGFVHRYRDLELRHFEERGPYLHTRYGFVRPGAVPGVGRDLQVEIAVHVWGLGFSYVDVTLAKVGLLTRQFVLPVAIDEGWTELRLGMVLRPAPSGGGIGAWLPRVLLDHVVAPIAMRHYVADVLQDRAIWENKIHLPRPLLAQGDGPIGRYRRWCRQFYERPAVEAGAAGESLRPRAPVRLPLAASDGGGGG